jgi:protein-S-isoprenylcysteine O-methyltransferase Ste14
MQRRILVFVFGLASYSVFIATYLYFIGFLGNQAVPKSIDSGEPVPFGRALAINGLLLALFALQHSIMARSGFKRWWTRLVPEPVERSTYVLFSSLATILLFWQWRPMTGTIWLIENTAGCSLMTTFFWAGWALIVLGSFLVSHYDLFGLRQVYLHLKGREYADIAFKTPSLYKIVRHPIMLGKIIVFWSTAHMTTGHLFFALFMTTYVLIGVRLEENDLVRMHGPAYEEYRLKVPMLFPVPKKREANL